MALIKKTVVLSDRKILGYASVIQVGSETGVKVVGETFSSDMQALLRIGNKKIRFTLSGPRTETSLSVEIGPEDEIGCLIAKNGTVFASGGASLSLSDLSDKEEAPHAPTSSAQTTDPKEPSTEEQNKDKEILDRLKKEKDRYYLTVKDKVDELFIISPAEQLLSSLIPDSEWVKVRYDGEDYYVVGRLYDENKKVTFLGYGVPGKESVRPPKIADGIATFLPEKEGSEKGYWLFFQNAENGKIE